MYCGNCGKKIPDGSAFCPACGAPVAIRQPQARPVSQSSQNQVNQVNPVTRSKKAGKKRVIAVIAAVAAVAVLVVAFVVNPLGIGDMSKKFQETSAEMTNDWNGAIGVYGSANRDTVKSLFETSDLDDSWNTSDWKKYQLTNVDYYVASTDKDQYAMFMLLKCRDSSSSNLMLNDLLSDTDDFEFEKTGKGWSYREDGYTFQIFTKNNYLMFCAFNDKVSFQAQKFINKVGF